MHKSYSSLFAPLKQLWDWLQAEPLQSRFPLQNFGSIVQLLVSFKVAALGKLHKSSSFGAEKKSKCHTFPNEGLSASGTAISTYF